MGRFKGPLRLSEFDRPDDVWQNGSHVNYDPAWFGSLSRVSNTIISRRLGFRDIWITHQLDNVSTAAVVFLLNRATFELGHLDDE